MKMTSRVLLPMYTDHQSVTAETLDCRKIFHHERLALLRSKLLSFSLYYMYASVGTPLSRLFWHPPATLF